MLKIILVEDNPGDQRLFQETLKETGIECVLLTASNGNEGLELVKKEKPDLMILDVMMPGPSGYEICNSLKFDPFHEKGMPIILLTGREEEFDPRIGKLMKVFYMKKPCKMEELRDLVLDLCKDKL
jgi:two-component system alkaline phosphatase synthesis response regulator PhoP